MRRFRILPLVVAALAAATLGCGATAYNVRAYRAYSYEEPKLDVAVDRTADLARISELMNRILVETPYTPGAEWIGKLPLSESESNRIRAEIKSAPPYNNSSYQVPLIKVYRVHLEEVLAKAPQPATQEAPPQGKKESSEASGGEEKASESSSQPDAGTGSGEPSGEDKTADAGEGESKTAERTAEEKPAEYANLLSAIATLSPNGESVSKDWSAMPSWRAELEKLEAKKSELSAKLPPYGQAMSESDKERMAEYDELKKTIKGIEKRIDDAEKRILEAIKTFEVPADDKKKQIVRDAEVAVSVLYRLELEALALLPVIAIQASRTTLTITKEADRKPQGLIELDKLSDLAGYVSKLEDRLGWQDDILEPMAKRLAVLQKRKDVEDTPGFKLRESLVDQVAGITKDSFRFNANAGGEALFFTNSPLTKDAQSTTSSDQDVKSTHNFTGRTQRLVYKVQPIYMLSGSLNVGFDWFHLPNAANLDLGYKTDRAFSSGGSIQSDSSLARQLGVKGAASDVLDMGLGVLGLQTAVRVATFTTGTVTQMAVDPSNDGDAGAIDKAPMQLNYTQIDVGYDIAFLFAQSAGKYYIEKVILGFRHLRYKMPRILYEMVDTNPSSERDDFVFVRESPAQTVLSKYSMGGVTGRFGPGEHPKLGWYFDMAIFAGAGPATYYFLYDSKLEDTADNRERFHKTAFVANIGLGFGLRYRITSATSRFKLNAEAAYRGDMIYSSISLNNPEVKDKVEQGDPKRELTFGGMDIFHGPRFSVVGSF